MAAAADDTPRFYQDLTLFGKCSQYVSAGQEQAFRRSGTPYGPYSDEKGQPAGEDTIRTALATATR
jgi:hypothetical protein